MNLSCFNEILANPKYADSNKEIPNPAKTDFLSLIS